MSPTCDELEGELYTLNPDLVAWAFQLTRDIPLAESSVDDIAQGWLAYSALGLPLDERVRAGKYYMNLNANDVKSAFAKWIRPGDLVEVTQGPTPP